MPEKSRYSEFEKSKNEYLLERLKKAKEIEDKLIQLQKLGKEKLNCSLAQLSIAWIIKNNDISTCILGAMKKEQIEENIISLEVYKKLNKEILEEIENIMKNAPIAEIDYFNNFTPLPIRRNQQEKIDKTTF
jgi:aryl-alcohol dehydrogenase-like predicted oxidoreductase